MGFSFVACCFNIFILLAGVSISQNKFRWVFPESSFFWGDEPAAHQITESRKRNWLWGIVIAFVVSLIAGILSVVLMKDRTHKIKIDKDIEMRLQKDEIEILRKEIKKLKK